MRPRIIVWALITPLLIACGGAKDAPVKPLARAPVVLQQEWIPFSGFAGELMAAAAAPDTSGIPIEIRAGGESVNPIREVTSGRAAFGVVAADKLLQARAADIDVVAVGVVNASSPTVFVALSETGIKKPADFRGHRIGVLEGTNTEYIYRLLMKKVGLRKVDVKEVAAPFDLGSFLLKKYDVRPAFIYDEPVTLELAKKTFNVIKPEEFGVRFLGTVYFTTGERIRTDPASVQHFVNAIARGWTAALANPDSAVKLLKGFDKAIDEKRELLALQRGKPFFAGEDGRILYAGMNRWLETIQGLSELSLVDSARVKGYWDSTFVSRLDGRPKP